MSDEIVVADAHAHQGESVGGEGARAERLQQLRVQVVQVVAGCVQRVVQAVAESSSVNQLDDSFVNPKID